MILVWFRYLSEKYRYKVSTFSLVSIQLHQYFGIRYSGIHYRYLGFGTKLSINTCKYYRTGFTEQNAFVLIQLYQYFGIRYSGIHYRYVGIGTKLSINTCNNYRTGFTEKIAFVLIKLSILWYPILLYPFSILRYRCKAEYQHL